MYRLYNAITIKVTNYVIHLNCLLFNVYISDSKWGDEYIDFSGVYKGGSDTEVSDPHTQSMGGGLALLFFFFAKNI